MLSDYSKGKFPNRLAEELYRETPDDECGDSSEGIGWAGLYVAGTEGTVLVESTDGFIDVIHEVTLSQWEELCDEFDGVVDG